MMDVATKRKRALLSYRHFLRRRSGAPKAKVAHQRYLLSTTNKRWAIGVGGGQARTEEPEEPVVAATMIVVVMLMSAAVAVAMKIPSTSHLARARSRG